MAAFDDSAFDNHERVIFCCDAATGLRAIIAIHSTVLGPAAGGTRLWAYESDEEALHDVLRLSQGMSYKNAMAGLKFGGGKAVIIKTPDFNGSAALYEKFGEYVDQLSGSYVTAEDVGMSVDIMEIVSRKTKYVSGLSKKEGHAGGDPSPKTSYGIFKGIEAAVKFQLGNDSVDGLTVAVQGAGATGVALNEILKQEADVVAPCALGAILNEQSIPELRTTIIAGGANNQLDTKTDGQRLSDAGILFAPDYVINAGGIINVASEYYDDMDEDEVMQNVVAIGPRLAGIFAAARDSGKPTNVVADEQARKIIADAKA